MESSAMKARYNGQVSSSSGPVVKKRLSFRPLRELQESGGIASITKSDGGNRSKSLKRKIYEKAPNEVILIEDCEGSATETEDDNQYEVEKVLNKRKKRGRVHYLVKWLGYRDEDNTWEPEDNLDCDEKIEEFEKRGLV